MTKVRKEQIATSGGSEGDTIEIDGYDYIFAPNNAPTGLASLAYLDDRNSPIALYRFNQGLTASLLNLGSLGSSANLSVEVGTERYSDMFPGKRAFFFDGSTRLVVPSFVAGLALTGDSTIISMFQMDFDTTGDYLITHGGASGTLEVNNFLYAWEIPTIATTRNARFFL